MKYSDLERPAHGGEIDLGRGRTLPARLLSPAEDAALRRAIPEPEAAVMKTDKGEPMVDGQGRLVRDDGGVEYTNRVSRWLDRYRAARIAISIGLETRCGKGWDRSRLTDPAEGHTRLGEEQIAKGFADAERARKNYCVAVVGDMLGDEEHDGLVTLFELERATERYTELGFGELVAASAEGNSGSAPAASPVAGNAGNPTGG
jgi:hypothetical protein